MVGGFLPVIKEGLHLPPEGRPGRALHRGSRVGVRAPAPASLPGAPTPASCWTACSGHGMAPTQTKASGPPPAAGRVHVGAEAGSAPRAWCVAAGDVRLRLDLFLLFKSETRAAHLPGGSQTVATSCAPAFPEHRVGGCSSGPWPRAGLGGPFRSAGTLYETHLEEQPLNTRAPWLLPAGFLQLALRCHGLVQPVASSKRNQKPGARHLQSVGASQSPGSCG